VRRKSTVRVFQSGGGGKKGEKPSDTSAIRGGGRAPPEKNRAGGRGSSRSLVNAKEKRKNGSNAIKNLLSPEFEEKKKRGGEP